MVPQTLFPTPEASALMSGSSASLLGTIHILRNHFWVRGGVQKSHFCLLLVHNYYIFAYIRDEGDRKLQVLLNFCTVFMQWEDGKGSNMFKNVLT